MSFYIQFPTIKGSTSDSRHQGWITCNDVSFNASKHVFTQSGHTNERAVSMPHVSDFVITKLADIASPKLFAASCSGTTHDKVVIHMCNNDATPYLEITLHKAIVSHYDMDASNSISSAKAQLQETFSLNATKVEMRYLPTKGAPVSAAYDIEQATLA